MERFTSFSEFYAHRMSKRTEAQRRHDEVQELLHSLASSDTLDPKRLDDWELEEKISLFAEVVLSEPGNREAYDSWISLRAERRSRRYDGSYSPKAFYWPGREKGSRRP